MTHEQFSRTEILLGTEAVEKLAGARVAVFGIGGVGGYTVEALARSGVGALDLIDSDTVICAGAVVGAKNDEEKICVVGTKLTVPAGMTIAAGDMVNEAKLSELKEGGNV